MGLSPKAIVPVQTDEVCPVKNSTDYEYLILIQKYKSSKDAFQISSSCNLYHSRTTRALEEVIQLPALSPDGFKLIMKKYQLLDFDYYIQYKKHLIEGMKNTLNYSIDRILTFKNGNRYKNYQEYRNSDFYKKSSTYLRYLTEFLISMEVKNFLRANNYLEKLINLSPHRLSFDSIFTSKVKDNFQKIIRIIDVKSIDGKKTAMLFDHLNQFFELPQYEPVFKSLQDFRSQIKSFWGRNYSYYYFKMIKSQISQKEILSYANIILTNIDDYKEVPIEVLFELLKKFPRNKDIMALISKSLGDFEKMGLFESFLVLEFIENKIFLRFMIDNLKNTPKAKFQIKRKIYLSFLGHPKLTLFAVGRLWGMGDKNTELLFRSLSVLK